MRAITVYSTRGGNGKTLTSMFLGIAAAKRGLKTIVIDADLEAPSLVHLVNNCKLNTTWVDFLENPDIDFDAVLESKCSIGDLDIILSPPPRIGKAFLGWKSKSWWKDALKKAMLAKQQLKDMGYDLIIIDNQSGTSYNSVNNLVFSELSIMVLRPATYGLGATESILNEVFNTLKGMTKRSDFYLWNQVHKVNDEEEKLLLNSFLEKWERRLNQLGLKKLGKVDYNIKLNLELLNDRPDLLKQFEYLNATYNELIEILLNADLA
ncbi:MAG: ParA family protein [Candidatus Heimdallarchaeota archaeon]|nr:ParA family protein [Candidatus Heimdallarchaeota archaeon]